MLAKLDYRYKRIKGLDWPSVTKICDTTMKWGLVYFYGKHGIRKAKDIAKEAIGIGTGLHNYIASDLQKKSEVIDVDVDPKKLDRVINNYKLFKEEYKLKPILLETVVFSRTHKYIGTLDYLGTVDSPLVLLDWKSSNAIYNESELQVSAYWSAVLEMLKNGELPEKLKKVISKTKESWVVRFDKEREIDFKTDIKKIKGTNPKAFNIFLGLLNYYNWNKNRK